MIYIRNVTSFDKGIKEGAVSTYSDDRRVVWHCRRRGLLLLGLLLDPQILHIAAAEDNLLVDCIGREKLVLSAATTLSAEGAHIVK